MYSKKSVGLIAVLVIAFLCANVGIGIERVGAAPNGNLWDDFFDPVIVSVEQSNDSPGQGEDVTITAHVTDIVGVTSVRLIYDTTEVAMTLDSGDENDGYWNGTIPGQPACTTLTIYVTACNTAGNCVSSEPHEKQWRDCMPPEIVAVSQDPEEPCAGDPEVITAHITDNVGVTSVTLTYAGTTVDMSLDSGSATDGYWTATIPGQTVGTTLTITTVATDAEGNQDTDTHEKHWRDCMPPEIVAVSQDPEEPCAGEPEVITAHVTDNVGVTSVTLTYDGTTVDMSLDSGSPTCVGTTLTIAIVARDAEGNQDTDTHEKHWRDCSPPEIVEVNQDPEEPCAGEPEVITARVTDNVGVTSVTLTHDGTTVDMMPGQTVGTTLTIAIVARDAEGNQDTDTHEKHWRDCSPPVVTILSPEEGMTYETTSIDLIYTVNEPTKCTGYSLDGAENITLIGNTTLEELPNGLHNLTICAEDLAGNVGSNTVNFEVFAIAPTIKNVTVSPTYALPGDSINISADVFDYSGILWARAFITKEGEDVWAFFLSGPGGTRGIYTGTWNTMIFAEGGIYNITISATDREGHEALATGPEVKQVKIPIDTEAPIVSDITVSPTHPAEPGTSINISARVFDNLSSVSRVMTHINKEGVPVPSVFMLDSDRDGIYTGTWHTTVFTEGGIYNVNIRAIDNKGNEALAEAPDVVIPEIPVDTEAPNISNIAVSPTSAEPGTLIHISAEVRDDLSGVGWVKAIINKEGEVITVFMADPDEDGIYTGTWHTTIFTEGGIYNIDISATDNRGNEALATAPDVVIPIDTEGPTISDVTVSPSSGPPGTKINISAHVSDPSRVRRVRAFINKDGELVWPIFMSPSKSVEGVYTGTWSTMIFTEAGKYSVDISATDERGNENLIKNAVEIEIIS
jgi:hypothetical protein